MKTSPLFQDIYKNMKLSSKNCVYMINFIHQNEYFCVEMTKNKQEVNIYYLKDTMKTRTANIEQELHRFTKILNVC